MLINLWELGSVLLMENMSVQSKELQVTSYYFYRDL